MKIESFRDLQRLAHGFQTAKVFFTANDLDLFSRLGEGREAAGLAYELGVDGRALGLLLNALVALGLLEKEGELYRNAPVAQEFLCGGENYRGSIFKHVHHCWEAWSDLPKVLASGHPAAPKEAAILGEREEWTRDFIRGMHDVTRDLAPRVVRQLDLGEARVLLDVGGGPGTYAAAFLEAHPSLREVRLFDLPGALEVGREKLAERQLLDRVRLVSGDFHRNELGSGVDAVWISQVLHSQSEEGCRMLIEKAWRALNPGGVLMIHEFLLDEAKTSPLTAALFAVHMLVMTEAGRAYSGPEIAGWMAEQGFHRHQVRKVSEDTAVVLGHKPL
jgi:ubiquinone/menaquinone biosynthesis C-methylase UbiE